MWSVEHTEDTTASPGQLWAQWSRPLEWPSWDHDLRAVTVVGPFDVGSRGTLRAVRGPRTTFVLTRVEEGVGFTLLSPLPLGTLTREFHVEARGHGARFTHRITLTGALGPVFTRLLGRRLERNLPAGMRRLAALAVSGEG